jgi:hypothetical protein
MIPEQREDTMNMSRRKRIWQSNSRCSRDKESRATVRIDKEIYRIKRRAIGKAIKKYKKIYPCGGNGTLMNCFTFEDELTIFWFNSEDRSTHVVLEKPVRKAIVHDRLAEENSHVI